MRATCRAVLFMIIILAILGDPVKSRVPAVEAQSKGTIKAGAALEGAIGSLFGWWWNISAALHIFAMQAANDIQATNFSPDSDFAIAVSPADLELASADTFDPDFPPSVNQAVNAAINSQLDHASVLTAAATATNRFFTALQNGDMASAKMQLQGIETFVKQIDLQEDVVADQYEALGAELISTGSDRVVDETTWDDFQSDLAAFGFPQDELDGFDLLLANIDPVLLTKEDPIAGAKSLFLSLTFAEIPHSLSEGAFESAGHIRLISTFVGPFPTSVGGVSVDIDRGELPLEAPGSSGGPGAGVLAGTIAVAVAAGGIALGGAAWYARRRSLG